MAIWAALPAVASIAAGFMNKKKEGDTVSLEQLMPDWQRDTGQELSQWIRQYMNNFVPGEKYTGKFTAGPTSQETTGLDMLTKFLGASGTGDLFNAGKTQIMDTLGGRYADPNSSPFIKSMINLSKQNLGDLVNESRAKAGARGSYYSKSAIKNEGLLNERVMNNLNSLVGDFINTERGRMFQAAPVAQALDEYSNMTVPLQKISASQTLGSLMRTIEQSDLEAKYQDFLNQRKEKAMPISAAQDMYGTNTQFGIPSYTTPGENSSLSNILGMISKFNMAGLGGSGDIWSKIAGMVKG